jgi:hypothetical protein
MRFGTGIRGAACCAGLAIALVAVLGVSTAAAISPAARLVEQDGTDSGNCVADPCQTIQYAVDQANGGDTVDVAAGTYDEPQVIADKPLTLQGAGAGQTIVDGSSASGLPSNGLIRFDSPAVGDVSVRGFTLEGANGDNAGSEALLMLFSGVPAGSHVSVSENELLASAALDPDIATDYSLGIYVSGSAAAIEVEDNLFEGMWQGILVEHSTGPTTISGNEFAGMISATAGPDVFPGEGILLLAVGKPGGPGDAIVSPQMVSDNYFHGYAGLGVAVQAGHSSISPNTPNSFSDVTVAGNEIALDGAIFPSSGRPLGGVILKIGRAGSTIEDADILANTISVSAPGNDVAVEGAVSGTEAHVNRLAAAAAAGLDASLAAAPVSAADNWWGCNAGPGAPGCTTASGNVTSSPNLVLRGAATPSRVEAGQSATVIASLDSDSDSAGAPVPGVPGGGESVAFAGSLGALLPGAMPLFEGVASSTFNAGAQTGEAGVTVGLDGQLVAVPLEVVAPPATTPSAPVPPAPEPLEAPPIVKPAGGQGPKDVPGNGQLTAASVSCPSGTCEVAANSPKVMIGGKEFKIRVRVPKRVSAGDSAPVRVVLPRAARRAFAAEGRGRVTLRLTVTTADGTEKTVTVTVVLKDVRHGRGGH